jgi:hypothetical protein
MLSQDLVPVVLSVDDMKRHMRNRVKKNLPDFVNIILEPDAEGIIKGYLIKLRKKTEYFKNY